MGLGSILYFARARGGGILLVIPIVIAWYPSHYFFKWLRKKHHSNSTLRHAIISCVVISASLITLGMWLGEIFPSIGSLGARSGSSPVDINLMWIPSGLLALGMWAGFLSGYVKMRKWD